MGSILKSWSDGYKAQNAKNIATGAAIRKEHRSAMADAAKESRLVTGAGEDEFTKIQTLITSDDWDPSMTGMAMDMAKKHDRTYGHLNSGGQSAQRFVLDSLHIKDPEGRKKKAKHLSPELAEKWGANKPVVQDKMAGFATKKRWQEENIYKAQSGLMDSIKTNAFTANGLPDPRKVNSTILDWETQALASGNFERKELYAVVAEVRTQMGLAMKDMLKGTTMEAGYQEDVSKKSKMIEDLAARVIGYDTGLLDGTGLMEGKRKPFMDLNKMAQSLATSGMSDNYIRAQVINMAESLELTGGDISEYHKMTASIPPRDWTIIEDAYKGQPFINPNTGQPDMITEDRFIPLYDEATRKSYLAPLDGSYMLPMTPEQPFGMTETSVGFVNETSGEPNPKKKHGSTPAGAAVGTKVTTAPTPAPATAPAPEQTGNRPDYGRGGGRSVGADLSAAPAGKEDVGKIKDVGKSIKEAGVSFISAQAAKKAKGKMPEDAIAKNFETAKEFGRTSLTAEEHVRLYRGEAPEEVFK